MKTLNRRNERRVLIIMKNKANLVLLLSGVMIMLVTAIIVFVLLRASDLSLNSSMKYLEYQAVNPERNQALVIGAYVSFIRNEINTFAVFAVVSAALALIAYVTIAYIILNRIAKPIDKAEKPRMNGVYANNL